MKVKVFIIALLAVQLSLELLAQEIGDRTRYFPTHTEYVDTFPAKENVWVFIMAGQSNMAGRGIVQPMDTLPHPRVISIDKNNDWVYAKEPLHFYAPKLTGLDCGMSFARELIKSIDSSVIVALLPCAVGGTSIDFWLNDSLINGVHLKSNYEEKVDLAQKHGTIKGILWHQGESDAFPNKIRDYEMKLKANFMLIREYAGNSALPIIMGELGSLEVAAKYKNNWESINQIIHKVSSKDSSCYLIETSDLEQKSDSVHFDAQSQRILGQRYARTFLEILAD